MKYLRPVKKLTRLIFYARHMLYHVLIGVIYAWVLREIWGVFSFRQIVWSVFGSILPDVDHLIFFLFYGRRDPYSLQFKALLKQGRLSELFSFVMVGHKRNTNLWSHNFYIMTFLFVSVLASSLYDWKLGVILFGAMVFHFLFDILDDLLILGGLNSNWKRWGRRGLIP